MTALNRQSRTRDIARLRGADAENPLDLLVVGGGVTGAGALLDAAARGLSATLVEQDDLASGTSSRSSRLAHGGLRYLEQFEFGLVHEALTERGLLLERLAPHLVRPVPFIFPVARQWERPYAGAGVALYDMLSRLGAYGGAMPRPRALSKVAALGLSPGLDPDAFHSAVRYHDAQIDDSRHTLALARMAAGHGGGVVTRARVTGLLRDGERVVGARVHCDGVTFDVHAKVVVAAAGPWTDTLLGMVDETAAPVLRPSKGAHLVIDRDAFVSSCALIARTSSSVLFALPWGRQWLLGTTDTDFGEDPAWVKTDHDDVDYLLEQANRWFRRELTRDDVRGVYAGVRPLVTQDDASSTAVLSREHLILRPVPGFLAIAGGKYTTYRVMAKDVVNAAVEQLPQEVPGSTTQDIPLVGADDFAAAWAAREAISREFGLSIESVEGLLRRHGDRTGQVLELARQDPLLMERIDPKAGYLIAEAVVAVAEEGAQTLVDILVRRTRTAMEVGDGGSLAAGRLLPVLQPLIGWSEDEVAGQLHLLQEYPSTVPSAGSV